MQNAFIYNFQEQNKNRNATWWQWQLLGMPLSDWLTLWTLATFQLHPSSSFYLRHQNEIEHKLTDFCLFLSACSCDASFSFAEYPCLYLCEKITYFSWTYNFAKWIWKYSFQLWYWFLYEKLKRLCFQPAKKTIRICSIHYTTAVFSTIINFQRLEHIQTKYRDLPPSP